MVDTEILDRRCKNLLRHQKKSADELLFCKYVSKENKKVLLDKFCRP